MKGKRLLHTLRLWTIPRPSARANYLKKKKVFGAMGEKCMIMDRKVPLYAELIRLGDNVRIASNVTFATHDVIHLVLNNMPDTSPDTFGENIGCIDIGSNVFLGTGSILLGDIRIGDNVIVAAGSVVNRDIPSNSVVAGSPARVIGTLEDYRQNRLAQRQHSHPASMKPRNEAIPAELQAWMWEDFDRRHGESS